MPVARAIFKRFGPHLDAAVASVNADISAQWSEAQKRNPAAKAAADKAADEANAAAALDAMRGSSDDTAFSDGE